VSSQILHESARGTSLADVRPAMRTGSANECFLVTVLIDYGIGMVVALVAVVPIILAGLLVFLEDLRWPFHAATRVGRGGVLFRQWKLRTMRVGADKLLEEHLKADAAVRSLWQAHGKLSHDPRVTRVGRLLRALSVDELPQLFNVLAGHMSLVGPRPLRPDELDAVFGPNRFLVTAVKPGLTGWWQIARRADTTYQQRSRMVLWYLSKRSFWLDLFILLATPWAVVYQAVARIQR